MVHIIKDEQGNPIGWEMRPTTSEEHEVVAIVRDLQFFGFDDTHIVYEGLELIDPYKGKLTGNILKLSWIQRNIVLNHEHRHS